MEEELKAQTKEHNETTDKLARPQSIIISANGVKIESKLNPAAKEFYPAHLLQRYGSNRPPETAEQQQNNGGIVNRVGVDESESKLFPEKTVKPAEENNEIEQQIEGEQIKKQIEETIQILVESAKTTEAEKQEENENKQKTTEDSTKIENLQTTIKPVENHVTEIALKATEQTEIIDESAEKQTDEGNDCVRMSTETDKEGTSESGEELKLNVSKDETVIAPGKEQILAESGSAHESAASLSEACDTITAKCGEVVTVESVGDAGDAGDTGEISSTGELEEILDAGDNGRQKSENEANFIMYINQISHSQTNFDLHSEYQVPPTTPTDDLNPDAKKTKESSGKTGMQHASDAQKQLEKKSGKRKLSKIAVGTSNKPKPTVGSKSPVKTNSLISRTKHISESLHNLSTALKLKADVKKSEAGTKLLPRSSTTIPRSTVRSRKSPAKPLAANCNGVCQEEKKPSVKDAISLRSTSSTERSITSKSSLHSSGHMVVHCKASVKSTKLPDRPLSTVATKPKEAAVTHRLPRGTLASTLRQSEAQKRRNLFPNDDPESNTNIELSQFLFK